MRVIEDTSDIVGVFCHSGGTVTDARIAVPAKVWQDDAVVREEFDRRLPKLMMDRERVKQKQRWSLSQGLVNDGGVGAVDGFHQSSGVASR